MFNQGMLNVILDRTSGGPPVGVPRERPAVGLLNNLVRLTDKALRNYDTARFELSDYLDGRDGSSRQSGVRISPYIRAVDHMENVVSALARGVSSRERLQTLGFGRGTAKMPDALRLDVVRFRDMIEHADDRLTKENTKASRQPSKDQEPYALRLEDDFAWMGGWKIDYLDLVTVITYLYEFVELLRGVKAAGNDHPQSITRTTVTFIGKRPDQHGGIRSVPSAFGSCPASRLVTGDRTGGRRATPARAAFRALLVEAYLPLSGVLIASSLRTAGVFHSGHPSTAHLARVSCSVRRVWTPIRPGPGAIAHTANRTAARRAVEDLIGAAVSSRSPSASPTTTTTRSARLTIGAVRVGKRNGRVPCAPGPEAQARSRSPGRHHSGVVEPSSCAAVRALHAHGPGRR